MNKHLQEDNLKYLCSFLTTIYIVYSHWGSEWVCSTSQRENQLSVLLMLGVQNCLAANYPFSLFVKAEICLFKLLQNTFDCENIDNCWIDI